MVFQDSGTMSSGKLLSQPFYDGLKNVPDGRKKEFNKIKTWLGGQPHLPEVTDDYIYLFLHACYYNVEKTKHCIDRYFTIRTKSPLFHNRDLHNPTTQDMFKLAQMAILPQLTPEGYRILIYRLRDYDYRKMIFHEGIKAFCMVNDCILSEDGLVNGYIIVFDMKGVQLGHLARVTLPPLRTFLHYIQDAHPARLRAVHVVNTAHFVQHVLRLVTPLVKVNILDLIKFHQGNEPKGLPLELMPEDYGGNQPPLEVIHQQLYDKMMEKYPEYLLQNEQLKVDETKRARRINWLNILTFGGIGTVDHPAFKFLSEID